MRATKRITNPTNYNSWVPEGEPSGPAPLISVHDEPGGQEGFPNWWFNQRQGNMDVEINERALRIYEKRHGHDHQVLDGDGMGVCDGMDLCFGGCVLLCFGFRLLLRYAVTKSATHACTCLPLSVWHVVVMGLEPGIAAMAGNIVSL